MTYPRKRWTEEEKRLLEKLHGRESYEQIAEKLGKTAHGVKKKAVALGLHEKKHSYKFWTGLEEEKLKILYPDNSNVDLALVFSVTQQAIQGKARKLGLQKSKNFRPRIMSKIMKGNQHAVGSKHSEQTKKVISQKVKEFRAKPETKQRYREWWNSLTEEEKEHVTGRSVEAMKAFWDNMTTEEKSDFVKPRREKANKARLEQWAALTTEEKEIKMKNIRKGWNDWYNNLSKKEKEEHITPARIAASQTSPTSIEIAVQEILDILNIEYEAQKPIGKYIADFYIPAQNLIIECDGDYWHSLPDVKKRDKQKDKYLRKQGYTVKRLPEKVIKNDKHAAVKQALGS